MSDDLIARARAALDGLTPERLLYHPDFMQQVVVSLPEGRASIPHTEYVRADLFAALEAEVERLREAERTAWIAGRDAAADEIDAKCERVCDYPDGCRCGAAEVIRALTPEASHD
jgi:hypothetical protein